MDALGIKIEPTAGDATNSGIEQVFRDVYYLMQLPLYAKHIVIFPVPIARFKSVLGETEC